MSRSGYVDDDEDKWAYVRWRGAVKSALSGSRGQAFLRELVGALDALPEKKLSAGVFSKEGCLCALGVVGKSRGLDMSDLDRQSEDDALDPDVVGDRFGLPPSMVQEVMFVNDEVAWHPKDDEERFRLVRQWAESNLKDSPAAV